MMMMIIVIIILIANIYWVPTMHYALFQALTETKEVVTIILSR